MAEQRLIPKVGSKVHLKDYDPDDTVATIRSARAETAKLEERLADYELSIGRPNFC